MGQMTNGFSSVRSNFTVKMGIARTKKKRKKNKRASGQIEFLRAKMNLRAHRVVTSILRLHFSPLAFSLSRASQPKVTENQLERKEQKIQGGTKITSC